MDARIAVDALAGVPSPDLRLHHRDRRRPLRVDRFRDPVDARVPPDVCADAMADGHPPSFWMGVA